MWKNRVFREKNGLEKYRIFNIFSNFTFLVKRSKGENSATVLTPSNHEPTKTNHGTKDVILKKKKKHRPGDDSKKIEDKHHLPESKLTNSENDLPKKKKKRPWRAHVRREAKKARLAEERAEKEANGRRRFGYL